MPPVADQELPAFESGPLPTVLLQHDRPDGSQHLDWMISPNVAGTLPLVTFRLDQRLDKLEAGHSILATRIQDHRPLYLGHQGPISGDRGVVKRLSSGQIAWRNANSLAGEAPEWDLEVNWREAAAEDSGARSTQILRLKSHALASQWRVFCVTMQPCRESR